LLLISFALASYWWTQRLKTFLPVAVLPKADTQIISTSGILLQMGQANYIFYDWHGMQRWHLSPPSRSCDGTAVNGSAFALSPDGHNAAIAVVTRQSLWVQRWRDGQPREDSFIRLKPYVDASYHYYGPIWGYYGLFGGIAIDNNNQVMVAMTVADGVKVLKFQGKKLLATGNLKSLMRMEDNKCYGSVQFYGDIFLLFTCGPERYYHFVVKNQRIAITAIPEMRGCNAASIANSGAVILTTSHDYALHNLPTSKIRRPNGSFTKSDYFYLIPPGGNYVLHQNVPKELFRVESLDGQYLWQIPTTENPKINEIIALSENVRFALIEQFTNIDADKRFQLYERPGKIRGFLPVTHYRNNAVDGKTGEVLNYLCDFECNGLKYFICIEGALKFGNDCIISPDGHSIFLKASTRERYLVDGQYVVFMPT